MPMLKSRLIPTAAVAATLFATAAAPMAAQAGDDDVTVIFTRHAEKQTTTTVVGMSATWAYDIDYDVTNDESPIDYEGMAFEVTGTTSGDNLDEVCKDEKCAEELSDLGLLRAKLLVSYFDKKGILDEIDSVHSSHKYRTYQTVLPTAMALDLPVNQYPENSTELSPQGTSKSECPTLVAIRDALPGQTLLIAGHSGTLYDIMGSGVDGCDNDSGLGLDISDNDAFPKAPDGKVRDFGDLWTVTIKNGEAKLKQRVNLQPLELGVFSKAK